MKCLSKNAIKVVCLVACLFTVNAMASKTIRIGIVSDGNSTWSQSVRAQLDQQLNELGGTDFNFLVNDNVLVSDWSQGLAKQHLNTHLDDSNIDMIVTIGLISSDATAELTTRKPVFASTVIDPINQGFKISTQGASQTQNLHFLVANVDAVAEIKRFQKAINANKVGVLTDSVLTTELPFLKAFLSEVSTDAPIQIISIDPSKQNVQSIVDTLPNDIDGLFVLPQQRLSLQRYQSLIIELASRNIKTFSTLGRIDVEKGFLMGVSLIPSANRLARQLAIDIRDVALGRNTSDLTVSFEIKDRLVLNMQTAREIDFDPSFTLLAEAEVINELPESGRVLTLFNAIDESLKRNLDIAIANEDFLSVEQDTRIAKSALRPQVSAYGEWQNNDRDLVSNGGPTRTTSAGLSLSQSLYSETNIATYTSSKYLQAAQAASFNRTKLDVIEQTAIAYLNVLTAKTEKDIQQDNLKLTIANLERAKFRYRVGSANRSEVLRFETELGSDKQSVSNTQRDYQKALIALNQILHRPIDDVFITQEPGIDSPKIFGDERLAKFLTSNKQLRIFGGFLTEKSLSNAPELVSLKNEILAQERTLLAANRKRYVPNVDLTADVNRILDDGGAQFPTEYDNDWSVGVNFSWTLYQGNKINAQQSQEKSQLRRLKFLYKQQADTIETNTRSAIAEAGASRQNIDFANSAAQAALGTLDLVADSYVRGQSSYIDLIDAQTAYLTARLSAANNLYVHLLDLITVQRAIGFFDFYVTPSDENQWFQELYEYTNKNRMTP